MSKPGEERHFDCLSLIRRECLQCRAQRLALLALLENIVRIGSHLGQRLYIAVVSALLTALETEAVDRPRTRLVHDPAKHCAVRRVVPRCAPPDIMEDIDCDLFSGFPVGRDSHNQSKDEPMSHLVEGMKRELVTRGN